MLRVKPERFQKRAVFVGKSDDQRFPASGRHGSQRPHVLYDNILFPVIQPEFPLCIAQSGFGMGKTVKTLPVAFFMPVIQKEIMQKCASHHTSPIHAEPELSADPKAHAGNGNAVFKTGNIRMLDKGLHSAHIVRFEQLLRTVA